MLSFIFASRCLHLLIRMICCVREARFAKPHRLKKTLLWKWCKILTAIGTKDLPAGSAMVFPSTEPEVDLTVLTARDG
jgi:hypothetical protein